MWLVDRVDLAIAFYVVSMGCMTIIAHCSFAMRGLPTLLKRSPLDLAMWVVGLTGGISTGKSTVSAVARERGVPVVDADFIAREVVQPGRPALERIRQAFGSEVMDENGALKRERLGEIVFGDAEKRRLLNSITHPAIRLEMAKQMGRHLIRGARYVILDTPLLFEAGYDKILGTVIVVHCSESNQLARLMKRDSCDEAAAKARIAAQMPLEDKVRRASHLIANDGDLEELKRQANKILDELDASWTPHIIRAGLVLFISSLVYALFFR